MAGTETGPTTRSHAGRWDTTTALPSSRALAAADQLERHIRPGLRGALLDAVPLQKSHAAAIVTAADFRIEGTGGGQADAKQLVGRVAIEGDVEDAAGSHFLARPAVLSREPQQL